MLHDLYSACLQPPFMLLRSYGLPLPRQEAGVVVEGCQPLLDHTYTCILSICCYAVLCLVSLLSWEVRGNKALPGASVLNTPLELPNVASDGHEIRTMTSRYKLYI
jgi:hypothetical protein